MPVQQLGSDECMRDPQEPSAPARLEGRCLIVLDVVPWDDAGSVR